MMRIFSSLLLAASFLTGSSAQPDTVDVIPVNYTDEYDGMALQGFLSEPDVTPAPAIVIIPDWDGVNFYEQQRATMIAQQLGYVAFAADVYGPDKHNVTDIDERMMLAGLYRENSTLGNARINAAINAVKELDSVDAENVGVIGYCFGGSLVITYGVSGEDNAVAIASFHGGLSAVPNASATVMPKILILSGGEDDASSDIVNLEETLNAGNATWEITRYSGIEHAFTVFDDDRYNEWADQRSWESMHGFMQEAFGKVPYDGMEPAETMVTPIDYTDVDGAELRGYLSLPGDEFLTPAPGVIILPNWDGVNEYEKLRATMLAESGYVAFAADIFGKDLQEDLSFDQRGNLTTAYRSNSTLFVQRIQRAIEVVKEIPEVDASMLGVIGYCFGGTGVIEYAYSGRDDAQIVASFHGGLENLPKNEVEIKPYVLVLSGGIDDAHGNQTVLEGSLNNASADWEITRYAQVDHGFTDWEAEAYNLMADARSWESMMLAFEETLPLPSSMSSTPSPTATSAAFDPSIAFSSVAFMTLFSMILTVKL